MIIEKKDDLFKIIDRFEKSGLTGLELEIGGEVKLKLSNTLQVPAIETADIPQPAGEIIGAAKNGGEYIKSPLIGTFYSSPSPDSPAFVKNGDRVKKGAVLCIVEAMKVMNEVECEFDCEIAETLAENGQMVEYGQPIFKVRR